MTDSGGQGMERVREILDLALERPLGERAAYVAGLCAGDDRLYNEATSLLRALDRGGELLEPPAGVAEGEGGSGSPLTGLCFGHYRVGERLGAGGMGVVYAAEDTRLGRTVAVKALPAQLMGDPHRLARLEHEARVLAALSHPNIGAIYGIEETERGPVLVLERVGGETLGERLSRGRMTAEEAAPIVRQVLMALESAHGAGIVHRDIKPSNIMVSPDGVVKVLDFGIAKAAPAPGAETATLSQGAIGTAAYMSPEQACGRPVDRRSDLWSLGCVLYEMLAGRRAFAGETASDTIAAVLLAKPDWSALPAQTPGTVVRLLRRCLEKDPELRQRDAGDARLDLDERSDPGAAAPWARRPAGRGRVTLAAGAGLALGVAVTALVVTALVVTALVVRSGGGSGAGAAAHPTRFSVETSASSHLWMFQDGAVAVSPDGGTVVYSAGPTDAGPRLYSRELNRLEAAPIAGTEHGVEPFFSPDGRWIGFTYEDRGRIYRVPVGGGVPELIFPGTAHTQGASWGTDGTIVFSVYGTDGLRRVPASGGEPAVLTRLDASRNEVMHAQPDFLPSGDAVLFVVCVAGPDSFTSSIQAVRPSSGERRVLIENACQPRWVEPGTLLYVQGGSLMAAPLDAGALRMTGPARRVLTGLAGDETIPYRRFDVSRNARTLVSLPGTTTYSTRRLARFSLEGTATTIMEGRGSIDSPRVSPDGRRLAMLMGWSSADLWVHDLERGTTTRLTTGRSADFTVWTPDGRRIAYRSMMPGEPMRIEWVPADGSAPPETLWTFEPGQSGYPTCFHPGGGELAVTMVRGAEQHEDLARLSLPGGPPAWLFPEAGYRLSARFNRDASLLAYTSAETGRLEAYLQSYPALDRRVQVSVDGGYRPAWSADGRLLFFRYMDRVYAADVSTAPELSVSRPRLVLEHLPDARFDVVDNGEGLVMGCPTGGWEPQRRIDVVVGWDTVLNGAGGGNSK